MQWYTQYKPDLKQVFAAAEQQVSLFPAPLNTFGQKYVAQHNPLPKESGYNYICYLLPFWVNELANLPPETVRRLSLGNVYLMLSIMLQDKVMDEGPNDWRSRLALAQLFLTESLHIYRSLFSTDSPFWDYYKLYMGEWASSVAGEGQADDFHDDPSRVSGRASPLKLASTGALLLSRQEEHIPVVSEMTDQTLLILQMSDDWGDWKEDLQDGSYNCLVSFIAAEQKIKYGQEIGVEAIKDALYTHNVLSRYAAVAAKLARSLEERQPPIHGLIDFAVDIADDMMQAAEYITAEKHHLLQGGLQYILHLDSRTP